PGYPGTNCAINGRRAATGYPAENVLNIRWPREGRHIACLQVKLGEAMEQVVATSQPDPSCNAIVGAGQGTTRTKTAVQNHLGLSRSQTREQPKPKENQLKQMHPRWWHCSEDH